MPQELTWEDAAPALLREGPCRELQGKRVLTSAACSMEEERGSVVGQGRASGGTLVPMGLPTNNSPAQEKNELHSAHWAPPPLAAGGSR